MDKNVCAYYRTSSAVNVGSDKDSKKETTTLQYFLTLNQKDWM